MQLDRHIYSNQKQHESLLRLLLTHDGSTTRLCEAVDGAPMQIHLHQQQAVSQVPTEVIHILGGNLWLQRVTSMHNSKAEVFMDNLSFTRLDAVPAWFIEALNEGHTPIGRLLDQLFIKRIKTSVNSELKDLLWSTVGMPDERASRSYYVATPEGPFMLIFEVFRDALTQLDRA
jgi:chorismate-pyruvate lyase